MPLRLLLADHPFVSEHMRGLIARHELPLVLTDAARELGFEETSFTLDEARAVELARAADDLRVYTASENSIGWIAANLPFTGLPRTIEVFKDKARFRRATRSLYPDLFFREVPLEELDTVDVRGFPVPFVIKPNVGFFSLGIHRVESPDGWPAARAAIHAGVEAMRDLYPAEVLDPTSFIVEGYIEGEEFAVDAYFDDQGRAVILGVWAHRFSSATDTSDRVYTTSKEIIEANREDFAACLTRIATLTGAGSIPIHAELRRRADGALVPIEMNPLRFGGWCTTADLTHHAFGFSPYVYYLDRREPDWEALLEGQDGILYSIVVLDNSTGVAGRRIRAFDYDAVRAHFSDVIELRRADFRRFPLFGFVFVRTEAATHGELDAILHSDLSEFITIADPQRRA